MNKENNNNQTATSTNKKCSSCNIDYGKDGFFKRQWKNSTTDKDRRCISCCQQATPITLKSCSSCNKDHGKYSFFKSQWKKADEDRRCISCCHATRKCSACNKECPKDGFTNIQWSKGAQVRRCVTCQEENAAHGKDGSLKTQWKEKGDEDRQCIPCCTTWKCSSCSKHLGKDAFSNSQRSKGDQVRRCNSCLEKRAAKGKNKGTKQCTVCLLFFGFGGEGNGFSSNQWNKTENNKCRSCVDKSMLENKKKRPQKKLMAIRLGIKRKLDE